MRAGNIDLCGVYVERVAGPAGGAGLSREEGVHEPRRGFEGEAQGICTFKCQEGGGATVLIISIGNNTTTTHILVLAVDCPF